MHTYEEGEKVLIAENFDMDLEGDYTYASQVKFLMRKGAIVEYVRPVQNQTEIQIPIKDKIFLKVTLNDNYIEPLEHADNISVTKSNEKVIHTTLEDVTENIVNHIPSSWVDYNQLWRLCGYTSLSNGLFNKALRVLIDKKLIEVKQTDRAYYRRKL